MTSVERDHILSVLNDRDIEYSHITHEHIHTSEEAAEARNHALHETVKSILLKVENEFILCVLQGNKRVDFEVIKDILDTSSVRLANSNKVKEVTGCEIGSVPPFGPLLQVKTLVDRDVLDVQTVYGSCGTHTDSISFSPSVLPSIGCSVESFSV